MNPDDTNNFKEIAKLKIINRVSLGIQSFDDNDLKILQRRHDKKQNISAINEIHKSGIENISIDLMYDIPHQNIFSFLDNFSYIEKLPISHVSLYNLTFEKNTFFYKNKEKLQKHVFTEKNSLFAYQKAGALLKKLKYNQYEISAFAKNNCQSVHNVGYWTGREFIGFGPAAFSYINKCRIQNICNLTQYIKMYIQMYIQMPIQLSPQKKSGFESILKNKKLCGFYEKLSPHKAKRELLAINLRYLKGTDMNKFTPLSKDLDKTIKKLINDKYLKYNKNILQLTNKGLLFYDLVASEIV